MLFAPHFESETAVSYGTAVESNLEVGLHRLLIYVSSILVTVFMLSPLEPIFAELCSSAELCHQHLPFHSVVMPPLHTYTLPRRPWAPLLSSTLFALFSKQPSPGREMSKWTRFQQHFDWSYTSASYNDDCNSARCIKMIGMEMLWSRTDAFSVAHFSIILMDAAKAPNTIRFIVGQIKSTFHQMQFNYVVWRKQTR